MSIDAFALLLHEQFELAFLPLDGEKQTSHVFTKQNLSLVLSCFSNFKYGMMTACIFKVIDRL